MSRDRRRICGACPLFSLRRDTSTGSIGPRSGLVREVPIAGRPAGVKARIGPAWTERGRPPAGFFTKRGAQEWLRDVLDQARRGTRPGMVRRGATFADAAAECLRYVEHDRECKPSTCATSSRRSLAPALRRRRIEEVTPT